MTQNFDNLMENVRTILIEHPETRGNDNLLIFQYWAKFSKDAELRRMLRDLIYDEQAWIANLNSPESIRRCRQKFQHDKKYLPTEQKDINKRRIAQSDYRRYYR